MPDSPDLTPPPGRNLSDEQRARIRVQLASAAQSAPARSPERWLVPGIVAAVVTAIVGAGAYGASHDSNGKAPGSQLPLQPAASSTAPVTSAPVTTPTPWTKPPVTHAPGTASSSPTPAVPGTTSVSSLPPANPKPSGGPPVAVTPGSTLVPTGQSPGTSCDQEIAHAAEPNLRGATVTAERDYGPGTTYLYETKTAWVVCDNLTGTDGGASTLLQLHNKSKPYKPDASTLAVSENFITKPDGSPIYDQFVAGGRDFDGVRAISYVFPDGHVEHAIVGKTGMWSMVYLADKGPFVDPKTNETNLDPIKVKVFRTDGWVQVLHLRWGLDTCAQLNHGC